MVAQGSPSASLATEIRLCGRLAVAWDGEPLDLASKSPQIRLLFAYLVLNRRRLTRRDELVAALWPDGARAAADAQLAPPLSRLRKVLGPGRLEGRAHLQLTLPDDAWIDWEAAQGGVEAVRAALAAGDHAAVRAAASETVAI